MQSTRAQNKEIRSLLSPEGRNFAILCHFFLLVQTRESNGDIKFILILEVHTIEDIFVGCEIWGFLNEIPIFLPPILIFLTLLSYVNITKNPQISYPINISHHDYIPHKYFSKGKCKNGTLQDTWQRALATVTAAQIESN